MAHQRELTPSFKAVMNTVDQLNIPNTTWTTIRHDGENFDTHNGYNTGTYTYTIPTGWGGLWEFYTFVYMKSLNAGNWWYLKITVNGAQGIRRRHKAANWATSPLDYMGIVNVSAGDTVLTQVYHAKGSNTPDIQYYHTFWGGHYIGKA